ncbi:apiosidase-like domain-containing protein, partial [Maribacter sp.]
MKTKIFANCRLLLVLYCSFTSIHVFAQGISSFVEGGSYPKMHVVEVEFNSQAQYNSSFTAYMDVDVWVDLSGPQGEMYRIPVFWDGGSVFRARLVGISTGNWSWNVDPNTVTNSDQGFLNGNNGKSGSFNVVVPPAGVLDENHVDYNPNFHGFIRVANNNRTLEYADGSPFFYTADTSWAILTSVFDYDNTTNTGVAGTTFQNYILDRKNQGFNGMNVISSFPNDTYTNLWATETHGKKTGPNGATPFEVQGVVDYKKINPAYWQSVDERMQYLADQGFVTLFETVRRTEQWPLLAQQDDKDSFYNYVRYLWARYGCYNMIFSWVHHDVQGGVYDDWLPLVQHAHDELSSELGNQMPYGQPRTSMSFNTSLNNWEKDIPDALDVQNVSNAERDEDMHRWLADIFYYRPNEPTQPVTVKPAFNLEPFYPGWGSHSQNEINPGLNAETMAQMQMYGSVLSGGLAGHAWGDAWHAGVAYASFVNGQPQSNALNAYESQAMGHLKSFILDEDHEYQRLKPAAETHLDNNQNYVQTLSIAVDTNNDVEFALGFFTANSSAIPNLIDLQPSKNYLFEWYNVTTGVWTSIGYMTTTSNGGLTPPSLPDTTKSWAYRIRSDDYVASTPTSGFALRINTGGAATIYNGDSYVADIHFDTGSALDRPQTGLTEPYKTFRYSTSEVM